MNGPLLKAENLGIGYADKGKAPRVVAKGLALSVSAGEFICLIGPNGAGKSTLLKTLASLQPPLSGNIFFQDRPLASYPALELARSLSVVLTRGEEAGFLSVRELVALGRHPYTDWLGRLDQRDEEAVAFALKAMGMRIWLSARSTPCPTARGRKPWWPGLAPRIRA